VFRAEGGRRLRVPRLSVRFCTQRPSRPDRSLFAWASSLAQDAAVSILREAVKETALFNPNVHLVLGKLGKGMGSAARAVCAQRYFAGDKRKQWGAYAEEILETQGCAYGCSCRSTWSHYAFFCA
jgi:hypothetical protein